MRIVLDTNILARAAVSPRGPAGEVFDRIAVGHVLVVAPALLDELSDVLSREWVRRIHQRSEADIADFLGSLEAGGYSVVLTDPPPRIVPADPDDDLIVAIAVAGKADVLCTRDQHFRDASVREYCRQHSIEVLDDTELLARLRETEPPNRS